MNNVKVVDNLRELEMLVYELEDGDRMTIDSAGDKWYAWWHPAGSIESFLVLCNKDKCVCCEWDTYGFALKSLFGENANVTITIDCGVAPTEGSFDASGKYWDFYASCSSTVHYDEVYRYIVEHGAVGQRYAFASYSGFMEMYYYFTIDVVEVGGRRAYVYMQGDDVGEAKEYGVILSTTAEQDIRSLRNPPLNTKSPTYSIQDDWVSVTIDFKGEIMGCAVTDLVMAPGVFLKRLGEQYSLSRTEMQFAENIVKEAESLDDDERTDFLKRMFHNTIGVPDEIINKINFEY